MMTLDPYVYVLTQDDLASFRLKARSDVIGAWEIEPHHIQLLLLSGEDRCVCPQLHFNSQYDREDSL